MVIHHKHLRMYRKQSQLNQADIAYLMQLTDESTISRWEQGQRMPSSDALIAYHLLFDIPLETLIEEQKEQVRFSLVKQIGSLLQQLQKIKQSQKTKGRMQFLEAALTRLTAIHQ
jgi:transcriptional regulator with XRE-family HTH domain